MVRLFYTKPALEDLKNIHTYISRDSQKAAKRFVSFLKEKIKILKQYPEIGKVIYQINGDRILIITIHRQSRLPEIIPALQNLF